MNLGFKCASGKYICMLSDDCLVIPGAITNGVSFFDEQLNQNNRIGAVAFYFRDWPEQKKYLVNIEFGKMYVNHGLYLRDALEKVGFIDEAFEFYNADIDLCLKLDQDGYKTIDSPDSYIEHLIHTDKKIRQSNNLKRTEDNHRILKKWSGIYYCNSDELKDLMYKIEKQFTDPKATYKRFESINLSFYLGLHKIYRKYLKPWIRK